VKLLVAQDLLFYFFNCYQTKASLFSRILPQGGQIEEGFDDKFRRDQVSMRLSSFLFLISIEIVKAKNEF